MDGHVGSATSTRWFVGGDRKLLNQEYPITEVTDADLTAECGTEKSRPPYSPCLARKTVDDVFKTCCQQHVPSNCHSLCTYEHREHVAAEMLISAVQQDGCDLKYLSSILYCAHQNRDNRKCCEFLGMSNSELGVGDRCLRMCNVAPSGDRINSVEKSDLVCLSNWNVMMYCARSGLRTFN
ncbi:DB module [Necator americanus]|uniref:DB module n=1 Tax=Necator americanus TaxID=51031 RepID=W2TTJ6_NECAM|nr:DB module [Necator americanus]ETN85390.1 DB module [Necator americanus]